MNLKIFNIAVLGIGVGFLAFLAMMVLKPALVVEQTGYRGIGMEQVQNANLVAELRAANVVPEEVYELEPDDGNEERASEIYENVQVLGHLSDANFTRFMAQITEWVSPEEGCAYCHANADDGEFADDDAYTKVVSRRMIQMTQTVNSQWTDHVGEAGVTCYTCHRGNPVPAEIWFKDAGIPNTAFSQIGWRRGQNMVSTAAAFTSMETDPLSAYLGDGDQMDNIRVQSLTALPTEANNAPIQEAESTYALMLHMSDSLGVNCTYCHNSGQFGKWDRSPPARTTAWHGLRMVKGLNDEYLTPLQPVYPDNRLGAQGDAPKASCATCHNGVNKPLYGANMVKDFPSLMKPGP